MGKNQYVIKTEDGWGVRGENNSRLTAKFGTKEEAVSKGREIAFNQKSELTIQGSDGKFMRKYSYGNDPHPPKG